MNIKYSVAFRAGAVATGLLLAGAALADVGFPPPICDATATYANHGEYVSCVAQNKDIQLGNGNSDAGNSEVGK